MSNGCIEIAMLKEVCFIFCNFAVKYYFAPWTEPLFDWSLIVPATFDFKTMCADS